ncbi:hypothetical protein TIFTF001_023349 [Ficus carica]|uniref:Transmembrane protein n=1 Tax=Ficus carica TaxID=3494 RepID=A0AA88DK60_FICCA|nr:hypothetical protein TIFTF001_023349 [Ficus carica]
MEKSHKIIRRSIYTFLQNYHHFTSIATLLALPFSASILLSQALIFPSSSSSLLATIYTRLNDIFIAAGFPRSLEFFTILNEKLSQTISSSIFTLPFTLTFFLLSKAYVIQSLSSPKPASRTPFSSLFSLYNPLLVTYICNSLLILSANATVFALLFFAFNVLQVLGLNSPNTLLFLSASGAVLYSLVLANTLITCNLGLVLSGMERSGGYLATLKACVLIKGRTSTALSLALPVNLVFAAVEALFHYRIVRAYRLHQMLGPAMVLEGVLIFYLYSILVVLDTVVNIMFCKSCKVGFWFDQDDRISGPKGSARSPFPLSKSPSRAHLSTDTGERDASEHGPSAMCALPST